MVNRLSNYLSSAKIAKLHINEAKDAIKDKKPERALQHTVEALEYMITAMNNVASIGFNHRPK